MIESARDYFIEKGQMELPFIEKTWQQTNSTDTEKAQKMLNGYTADFFNATIGTWDEIARKLWRQTWAGW